MLSCVQLLFRGGKKTHYYLLRKSGCSFLQGRNWIFLTMFKETRALKHFSDFLCCTYKAIHLVLCYLNFSTLYPTFIRRTSVHKQVKFSVECFVSVSGRTDLQLEQQMYLWEPTQLPILLIQCALSLGIKRLWLPRLIPATLPWNTITLCRNT
jgi:hypothetical protein